MPAEWTPIRVTGSTPEELEQNTKAAFDRYAEWVNVNRPATQNLRERMMPFTQDNPDQNARLRQTSADQERSQGGQHFAAGQEVFPRSQPLYTYMGQARMEEHVQARGLRISGGALTADTSQHGEFPRGVYGTNIPPYEQRIDQKTMRQAFFGAASSTAPIGPDARANAESRGVALPPNSPIMQDQWPAPPTTHFVAFVAAPNFVPRGEMNVRHGERETLPLQHFALPQDQAGPLATHGGSQYARYDIVAYGESRIPETVRQVRPPIVARSESNPEEVTPRREGGTWAPLPSGGGQPAATLRHSESPPRHVR